MNCEISIKPEMLVEKENVQEDNQEEHFNIFVYCGGKCGSSTLYITFLKHFRTIHIHSNYYYINIMKKNTPVFDIIDLSCKKYEHVYFIDSYRTPIERKISSFLQNLSLHLPNYIDLNIDDIINFFNKKFIYYLEEYHSINEVMTYYNVPLFKTFDFNKKYNILKKDNKIFIKLLFKNIDIWENIFNEIFSKKIKLCNYNLSETKDIFILYTKFKDKYKVPKVYIETILANDTEFKIYNTEEEQREYINKWLKRSY